MTILVHGHHLAHPSLPRSRLCMTGARKWFAHHGLDFKQFIMHGLPVEVIEATGDSLGMQVAAVARAEAAKGAS